MSNNQDVIIENVIRDTYMVFKLNPFENKTVLSLINEIDKYYSHTIFNTETCETIMNFIKTDSETQDIMLDFINTIYFKLKILGVNTDQLFSIIKDTTRSFTTSKDLDKDYIEQIVPDERYLDGVIMRIIYLIKIYGISVCLSTEGA